MEMGCNLFNFTNTTVASKYIWLKVILGLNFYCRSHFNARPCPALAPPVLENFLTQRRKGAETQRRGDAKCPFENPGVLFAALHLGGFALIPSAF
jgi:hypothetical protein